MTQHDEIAINDPRQGNGNIKIYAADEDNEYFMDFNITNSTG